jgi:hypothetical protein
MPYAIKMPYMRSEGRSGANPMHPSALSSIPSNGGSCADDGIDYFVTTCVTTFDVLRM